jgi:putative acetyltransferase
MTLATLTIRHGLRNFSPVLGSLSVAAHPLAQGLGVGRRLFDRLLSDVRSTQSDITSIERVSQENNQRAIALYESVGFRREGRFEGDIRSPAGGVEADIPTAWPAMITAPITHLPWRTPKT